MSYETLINEAEGLPDSIVEQTLTFMRFLCSQMRTEENKAHAQAHRTVSPLADEFVFMADDFDETPDCFAGYM